MAQGSVEATGLKSVGRDVGASGRRRMWRVEVTRPRVVLAEDHAPMAQRLRALLEPSCDVIESVEDGSALVVAAAAVQPDVIVSDIAMPRLSGLMAARIILAERPGVRIVFVTVRDEPSVVRAALQCGALAYVLKGDAGEELVTAVRTVLEGHRYVSTNARTALGDVSERTDPRRHQP